MSPEVTKRLYSVEEAARYLGVSKWSVRNQQWSGNLPCVRQGRRVLYDIRDIDQLIEDNKKGAHRGNDLPTQET